MFGSFHLLTVRGVPIRIHFTVFLLLLWVYQPGDNPLFVLIFSSLILLSVALHELGHTVVAQRYGVSVQDIVLSPIGGVARLKGLPEDPHQEIRIALAGPYVSLFLTIVGASLTLLCAKILPLFISRYLFYFSLLNLGLLLFNLIPCFPMDGGRVFRAWLSVKKGPLEATKRAASIGKWISIAFIALGLMYGELSLAIIGGFMLYSGNAEYRYMQLKSYQQQAFGQSAPDMPPTDFVVSPPPYAEKNTAKVPKGFLGDLIITATDLYEETVKTVFKR